MLVDHLSSRSFAATIDRSNLHTHTHTLDEHCGHPATADSVEQSHLLLHNVCIMCFRMNVLTCELTQTTHAIMLRNSCGGDARLGLVADSVVVVVVVVGWLAEKRVCV